MNLVSTFCQSVPKTPMKVGEPWEAIGQTAINAGRWIDTSSLAFLRISKRLDGSGATLRAASLRKPAIEKEARLRSQYIILGVGVKQKTANVMGGASCIGGVHSL